MISVVTDIAQITPVWLTQILRAEGYLNQGHVIDFEVTNIDETNTSQYAHIKIQYATGTTPCPSTYLFFKHTKPDAKTERMGIRNRSEAQFFSTISGQINLPVVP